VGEALPHTLSAGFEGPLRGGAKGAGKEAKATEGL